jgi:hypothetical protein
MSDSRRASYVVDRLTPVGVSRASRARNAPVGPAGLCFRRLARRRKTRAPFIEVLLKSPKGMVMRAIGRLCLAHLVIGAAVILTGAPSHPAAASAATQTLSAHTGSICPAGTNWDNVLHACV